MCFKYNQTLYENGGLNTTKDFLMSYPIIRFHAKNLQGKDTAIEWFPSEYLYREPSGQMYCLAADKNNDPNQVLFGSTLMRQHQYIFDIQNGRIGISRNNCSQDDNIVLSEADFLTSGRTFGFKSVRYQTGLSPEDAAKNEEYLTKSGHGGKTYPTNYVERRNSYSRNYNKKDTQSGGKSKIFNAENLKTVLKFVAIGVGVIIGFVLLIFIVQCCIETFKVIRGDSNSSSTI